MIFKSYLVETNVGSLKENIILFYGENTGLKIDLKNKIKNLNNEALINNLNQDEILADENKFFNELLNKSLFEDTKIFFINQANDKILKLINEIEEKENIPKIYIFSELLDKRFWKSGTFTSGIAKLENRLKEISNISKKINSDFYVVIYPWAETLEFGQENFNWSEFVKSICIKNQCKVIDAIPDFQLYRNQNVNWSNELYFLNDEHFNEKGASLLFKKVIKNIN